MEALYLDNVRGFTKAIIPISDVTFFVGENSTGKSSVLSILNFIKSFEGFWESDFDVEGVNLGAFTDLISAVSHFKTRFTIGSFRVVQVGEDSVPVIYFLSYESEEGLPKLTWFSFYLGNLLVSIRYFDNAYYYRTFGMQVAIDSRDHAFKDFYRLAVIHEQPEMTGYIKIVFPDGFQLHDGLIFWAARFIYQMDESLKGLENFEPFSFFFRYKRPTSLAPIRAKPKKIYDGTRVKYTRDGEHTPYLIRKRLSSSEHAEEFKKIITVVGRNANLFDDVSIKRFGDGDGAPFEVQVALYGVKFAIRNVGYGVSQVLPVVVESILQDEGAVFHIQQPEVHLHPRAQAALGEFFHYLAIVEKKSFLIETHSDFLIDRFRTLMRENSGEVRCAVLFFERGELGNKVTELVLNADGSYPESQPVAFRQFFLHEQFRILGL